MKTIYPWQTRQWELIVELKLANRLPHGLLVHGETEIGKSHFASVLAEAVICSSDSENACGFCKQCQLLASGSHPDLMIIEPEGAAGNIKVESIRELIRFLAMTSLQGGWKVAIINQAERLNINAANALLKSLEEPAPNTLLILVSGDISRLMATVKSRCRQIPFPIPARELSSNWLSAILSGKEDIAGLLDSSGGRPLRALRASSEGLLERRETLCKSWKAVEEGKMTPLTCAEQCSETAHDQVLDWLYAFVAEEIKQAPKNPYARRQFLYLDRLNEARSLLSGPSNPNKQLLWEELMLDWKSLGAASPKGV